MKSATQKDSKMTFEEAMTRINSLVEKRNDNSVKDSLQIRVMQVAKRTGFIWSDTAISNVTDRIYNEWVASMNKRIAKTMAAAL